MDEWSTLNPEFEHRVWSSIDCNRLVWDKDREFWNTWKLIPNEAYILKSDYIRVLILYSEGGFYFDCDVRPLNPLKPLTHSDINCVLFSEGINCISNAGMGFTEWASDLENNA